MPSEMSEERYRRMERATEKLKESIAAVRKFWARSGSPSSKKGKSMPERRYNLKLQPAALGRPEVLVTVSHALTLEAGERLKRLAEKNMGMIVESRLGRMTGERKEELVVSFPRTIIANALNFLAAAERMLFKSERHLEAGENVHGLKLYCFEAIFGPPIYLALHPERLAPEACAILAGEEVIEGSDYIEETDLAEISKEFAETKTVVDSGTLWQTFMETTEPRIVASGPVE